MSVHMCYYLRKKFDALRLRDFGYSVAKSNDLSRESRDWKLICFDWFLVRDFLHRNGFDVRLEVHNMSLSWTLHNNYLLFWVSGPVCQTIWGHLVLFHHCLFSHRKPINVSRLHPLGKESLCPIVFINVHLRPKSTLHWKRNVQLQYRLSKANTRITYNII